ncbi:MAG: NUDIX hydrolase [Spirochaetes bacterium]|jgi:ADP-ribose pyrophosphatase YjhB (NUDIX family)|nr:NUDIX hydrolase [Spirochaetota bacterium]
MEKRSTRIRVAAVIVEKEKLLLIAHKKMNDVYWLLPGGGVKYGESLHEALKREAMEELGIKVNICRPVLICDSVDPVGKRHILNICFYCSREDGEYKLGSDKRLHGFGFFSSDDISRLQVFPPIKEELISILSGNCTKDIYLGARWI